jgi:serine/threonine-protein kinase HipA
MKPQSSKKIKVSLRFHHDTTTAVGEMLASNGSIYFQYAPDFLKSGLMISPFKLRAIPEPQTPLAAELSLFEGLFGVFADSLPDGWGLLMMARAMRNAGLDFSRSSPLDRLSFVGERALGALVYEPQFASTEQLDQFVELSRLAREVERVFLGDDEDILPELLALGGSPGGARPKVVIGVKNSAAGKAKKIAMGLDPLPAGYEHWLLKFRGQHESRDAGIIEYIYAKTAEKVGLVVQDSHLFKGTRGEYYFATKRFDRKGAERIHCHSLAGLLHANFRMPSLDYESFLRATYLLTKRQDDLFAAFRLAVFNVLFHNRDDHAKNFAFIMPAGGKWQLSPAFDLTYSMGPGGEHTSAIAGEGRRPTRSHLLRLAHTVGIEGLHAERIMQEVEAGRKFMHDQLRQFEIKQHPLYKILA